MGLCLLSRLYYLQIIQGKHFKLLSDKNRIHSHFLLPSRGRILDKNGHILPFVRFEGGRLELSLDALEFLRNL
jgi:cell division protein FtsI/penicillin-binding protein 2